MNRRIEYLKKILLANSHHKYRLDEFDGTILNKDTENLPPNVRKALAFKKAVEEMPVYIQEEELIIGGRTIFNLPKYHTREEIKESKFSNNNIYDPIFNNVYNESIDEIGDHVSDTNPPNYGKIIKNGLQWYWDFANERLNEDNLETDQVNYYRSVKIVIEGAQNHIRRYVELLDKKIKEEKLLEKRGRELVKIRKDINYIIINPPKTFFQAIQLIYFIHTLLWVEGVCLVSLARLDQILWPLYKKDIKKGIMSEDRVLEVIECFIIKLNHEADRPNSKFEWLKGDTGQAITIGGMKEGNMNESGENDITFIILKAIEKLGLIDPHLHVRIMKNSDEKVWNMVIKLLSLGRVNILLNYDDNIEKALKEVKIYSDQDIKNYTGVGCWEQIIVGKSSYRQCGTIELLRPLEWLLYKGHNAIDEDPKKNPIIDNKYTGINMGNLDKYRTFEEFKDAYKAELRYYILMVVSNVIKTRLAYNPFISTFVDNCIEVGKDIKDGGAKYRETDLQASSLANIADSLYAIKELVFEEKEIALEDLVKILKDNFCGYENLRQKIINKLPKYGNGVKEVDDIAKEVAEFFASELTRYTNGWGGPFRARIAGGQSYVDNIKLIGATPDGRKIGDYTSFNASPQLGCDKEGPTGIIRTVSNIDKLKFAGGFILDLKFSKDLFSTQENKEKFKNLIKTYFKLGNIQLQFTVVNSKILREAQKNPELYKDLTVRVWGFSAYFVELPKEYQDHVIRRTEIGV
jgi:formate C-acetyltransferase